MLAYLHPKVKRIDLLHAFGGGSEDFSLPVALELDARVVINRQTLEDLRSQYSQHGLPTDVGDRVVLIENQVTVPDEYPAKPLRNRLKILYVGRGTEEKRVHLVGRIAACCNNRGLPAEFLVVGDAINSVTQEDRVFCTFLGELADYAQLGRIYADADVLLITSSREGFPMVIMEGMAHGVVPLSTNVGGISVHVRDGVTGWLVENAADEEAIVERMSGIIGEMCADRACLASMSRAAYDYAFVNFGGEKFCASYRALLMSSKGRE
jgi:glycosyltransferase involved in cell wall biosynthesis